MVSVPQVPQSFYKRPLPENCIAFSSAEGRTLFREALAQGTMEGFFSLIEQFHTEDAFGLMFEQRMYKMIADKIEERIRPIVEREERREAQRKARKKPRSN